MLKLRLASYLFLFNLLAGCASFEKISDRSTNPESAQMSAAATLSNQRVKAATADIESRFEQAKTENYAFYAPDSWEDTNRKIKAMNKIVRQFEPDNQGFFGGPSEKTVMAAIQEAQISIDKAGKTKVLMTDFLSEIFADIDYLKPRIGSKWNKEFGKITNKVNDLISRIERDGDALKYQTDRSELQGRLQKLEINIATENYYAPLKQALTELDKRLIPQTYGKAASSLAQLNNTIAKSPRDDSKIQQAADITKNNISLARFVIADVKWINGLSDSQTEAVVIRYRGAIEDLSKNILDKELPPLAFSNQVSELKSAILTKFSEAQTLNQSALAEQEKQISQLKAQLNIPVPTDGTAPSPSVDAASESPVPEKSEPEKSKKQDEALNGEEQSIANNEVSAKVSTAN